MYFRTFLLALIASSLHAQTITGLDDEETYDDLVTFTVEDEPGTTITAHLNGSPIPVGTSYTVDKMDFHELVTTRTPDGGSTTTDTTRFIIVHSDRGSPETGLVKWTPYPLIPSTAAELAGAHLDLIIPSSFPADLPVPIVAWVRDTDQNEVRVNGTLPGDIRILRGTGSGHLPAGTTTYPAQLGPLSNNKTIAIDPTTTWTTVSGSQAGATTWPANARIHITGDLTVPATATLTIAAGAVVKIDPDVNIINAGTITINGTTDQPVVLTATGPVSPEVHTNAWGGFVMETDGATLTANATIIVGGGADDDWDFNDGSSHRDEQAVILAHNNSTVTLTDSAVIDTAGQVGNGYNSDVTFNRTLLQRAITAGEYVGGTIILDHTAVIEFPADDGFVDADIAEADNDAIYFTRGTHIITNTLIGFCKDDAIDSGSGGRGTVEVRNCWLESALHEAMAWSGENRDTTTYDTVAINNGQGFECGWSTGSNSPDVYGERLLLTGNAVGARFGDNYDWDYDGTLELNTSLVLNNICDVWGYNWDDWNYRTAQMDIQNNHLTAPNPNHPNNTTWNPSTDAALLTPFMTTPATADVGIGIATWNNQSDFASLPDGLPVRLSSFTTRPVTLAYTAQSPTGTIATGTLTFQPGETLHTIPLDFPGRENHDLVRLALSAPVNAEITGLRTYYFLNQPGTLVSRGSVWKYNDSGTDPGQGWNSTTYDDSSWSEGPAELGDGDGDEATEIDIGPGGARFPTLYFRKTIDVQNPAFTSLNFGVRRDDGAAVYLNGTEVYRDDHVPDDATHDTYATGQPSSETAFEPFTAPAALLRPGPNVIAVEVHQRNATSSDISFDLELVAAPLPKLNWNTFGTDHVLHWSHPDAVLEHTSTLSGPWLPLSPTSPVEVQTIRPKEFFRLRVPD
ncbi:MAG: polymer-forming cytoskeletal protein [Verrucomicrobiales bacterium]|nr:polymer-forming cytoskeletal protein [Verrucomicrobiales bacterium]